MTICQRISQLTELFEHKDASHRLAAGIISAWGQCVYPRLCSLHRHRPHWERIHCRGRRTKASCAARSSWPGSSTVALSLCLHVGPFCRSLFSPSALIQLPNCRNENGKENSDSILRTLVSQFSWIVALDELEPEKNVWIRSYFKTGKNLPNC